MRRRVFRDKDLADAGLKKYLPWKAFFFRACLGRACRCLVVDFSKQLSRRQLLDAQEPAAISEPD